MKSWIDLRAIALAFVLAVAAALPSITTSVVRRDYYFFDITLTSTSPGVTQLFWDLGRGYNEQDSSRQPLKIEPKPVVYRYMMPMGDFKALRFDPIDGLGEFTYSHARIVNYRGHVVREFSPKDFRAVNDVARLEVFGDTVLVVTKPDAHDVVLAIDLKEPLHLSGDLHIWNEQGRAIFLPVFILGLIVGCPAVAGWFRRRLAPVAGWLRARPGTTLLLAATAAVAVQCHPVIFLGRSFATPMNGSLMLYGEMPTLPGTTETSYTNTMSSDTGALLFNHLYYPMVEHEALRHGELPLWNRYSLGGMPLLGQGQSMFGEPLNFLPILANGAAWAWDVRFLLAHWLFTAALTFTAWRLTRHLAASVLVAIGSAFIGFFTFRLNHPANFSECYAPLILWAWVGLIHASTLRRQAGWLAALILANWMVMTSGTVKEAYMANACLNFAGVILLVVLPGAAGRRWRVFAQACAAGGIFVLLSAPLVISFLVALGRSWTAYDAGGVIPLPLAQVIGFFDDIFYRQATVDERVVAPALNFFLLLGVLWWLMNPGRWRADPAGRALALGCLLPFALAFGLVPSALILKIPLIASIYHIGNTFSCSLMPLAVLLAGCGFRDALDRAREPGWSWRLGAAAAIVAGLLAAFFISTRHDAVKSAFFDGYLPGLLAGLVALPLGFRWAARLDRPGLLYVGLALALPLLLWRHCQYANSFFDQYAFVPGTRHDLRAPSAGVKFVDAQAHAPGRRVGWGKTLFPAYNIALGWEGLYGVDTLRSRYYHDLALQFDMQRVWVWDAPNRVQDAARLVPIHDLLNADYYVADHAEPAREFAGVQLVTQLDLDVYQSPTAWPRAFFTDRLGTYGGTKDFATLVNGAHGRPFAVAQKIQTDAPALSADLNDRTVRAATDYKITTNNTTFVIDAPAPGIAVLTEAYYDRDFEASLDGRRVPYFRVNHAFKGVAIPSAGRHKITFAYWPQYLTLSLWLAAAGALLAALAAGWIFTRPQPA